MALPQFKAKVMLVATTIRPRLIGTSPGWGRMLWRSEMARMQISRKAVLKTCKLGELVS